MSGSTRGVSVRASAWAGVVVMVAAMALQQAGVGEVGADLQALVQPQPPGHVLLGDPTLGLAAGDRLLAGLLRAALEQRLGEGELRDRARVARRVRRGR